MFTFDCPSCVVCGRAAVLTFPDALKPVMVRTVMTGEQGVGHEDGWFGDDTYRLMMKGIHPECDKVFSASDLKLF